MDYFELNILPLFINVSKYHCYFFMEFFINENIILEDEEVILDLDKSIIKKNEKKKIIKEEKTKISESIIEKEYPTFFKHVRINETLLTLSIFFYEKSKLVNILFNF